MPAYLSDYGADLFIQTLFGQTASAPGTYYLALLSDVPDSTQDGTSIPEVSGGSYARVALGNDSGHWTPTSNGIVSLATTAQFNTPSADWGQVTAYCLLDTATLGAGNMIAYGTLSAARYVATGALVQFNAGDINFGMTSLPEQIIA